MSYPGYHCLPLPPMSKDKRKMLIRGRNINNPEYYEWRAAIQEWLRTLRLPLLPPPLAMRCVYVRPNRRRADNGNAVSGFEDCATGILYKDDSDLYLTRVRKIIDKRVESPQLWFKITCLEEGNGL